MRTHALHSWFLRLTIAGCLAACLVASPASAASGWSRPVNVSEAMSIGEEPPLLSVDSAGDATAVWRRYRNGKLIYESAVRQGDGPWSTPSPFFRSLEDGWGLQIAIDPLGNETAIWGRRLGHSWVVQSATRAVGGSWSEPVTLSAAGAGSALLAAGPEGNVTAVWLLIREEGRRSVVQSATRSAGGSWSVPVTLSPPRKAARSPKIALDPRGGATAVWELEFSGAIESSTRSSEGIWSARSNSLPTECWALGRRWLWMPRATPRRFGQAGHPMADELGSKAVGSKLRPARPVGPGRRRSASPRQGTATSRIRRSRSAPRARRP